MWWCLEVGSLGGDRVMRVESLWMGLVPSWKRPQRAPSSSFCQVKIQWEVSSLHPNRALIGTQSCWHLNLGLPASRMVRNTYLLLTSHPEAAQSMVLWYSSLNWLRHSLAQCFHWFIIIITYEFLKKKKNKPTHARFLKIPIGKSGIGPVTIVKVPLGIMMIRQI